MPALIAHACAVSVAGSRSTNALIPSPNRAVSALRDKRVTAVDIQAANHHEAQPREPDHGRAPQYDVAY